MNLLRLKYELLKFKKARQETWNNYIKYSGVSEILKESYLDIYNVIENKLNDLDKHIKSIQESEKSYRRLKKWINTSYAKIV